MPRRVKILLLTFVMGLFVVPVLIVAADVLTPYPLATIAPQTIGIVNTWPKGEVTVVVVADSGVRTELIDAVKQSVPDWNSAIHTRLSPVPSPFHVTLIDAGPADITFRIRKTWDSGGSWCHLDVSNLYQSCELNIGLKQVGSAPKAVLHAALNLLGFGLGVGRSDARNDVMYDHIRGTGSVLSNCDLDVWEEVMDWLLKGNTTPYRPSKSYLIC